MADNHTFPDYKLLFEDAPCGYVLVGADGTILLANKWMSGLLDRPVGDIAGKRLRDIFSIAGRVIFETNLIPLLKLQQAVDEVTLDLRRADGKPIPVILTAASFGDGMTRIAFVRATERRLYERQLVSARDTAENTVRVQQAEGELREQFIAVLGHDLRNPLASMSSAARILAKETLSDRGRQVIGLMQGSALRMSGLIDNVLDFARARLGNGIGLDVQPEQSLEPLLDQVVEELRSANPGQAILTTYAIDRTIACDPSKIGQLASNLLGNALNHGGKEIPVRLSAETTSEGVFRLRISNGGEPIPPEVIPRLFDPFVRGQANGHKSGLGLGLFISHEIAKAHGGSLNVTSSDLETEFTFEMPV